MRRRAVPEAPTCRPGPVPLRLRLRRGRASRCSTSPTWRIPGRSRRCRCDDAHSIYLARTYAYVAAGTQGLVILDIEKPEQPRIDQIYNAGGCINDLNDVKLGITYVSEFAYLADGKNGLRVVQLTSPETPGNYGLQPPAHAPA